MNAAERQHAYRARRARGRRVYRVEIDEVLIEQVLRTHGYLPLNADDPAATERALAAMLDRLCDVTRNGTRD
ncbi:MAG: hypothetical protein ACR65U_01780 [Methylocystis sp.]